ncbi:leucine-rich repeat protein [Ruminococcus albus]|uniref:leucine-rich repeat protein n=1 Tax=Ruminococcus albus TaxID=1264 RepID=UPI000464F4C6|nr:leucine-rich repeat protein [Ruminococcus albus]
MSSFKRIASTAAAVVLTFTGTVFSSPIASNISYVFPASITAEAISVDQYETFYCTDTYGTWKFALYHGEKSQYSRKDTSKMTYTDPKVYICQFTPKNKNNCPYVSLPTTVSGSVKDFNNKSFTIDKAQVVGINYGAFQDSNVESVFIPAYIEVIEHNAFMNCKKLTTVSFGNGSALKRINGDVFANCSSLKYITLPSKLEFLGGCFSGCTSLTNINIPSKVKEVQEGCFENCVSLRNINCNLNTTKIMGRAFVGCNQWRTINFEDVSLGYDINPKFKKMFSSLNVGDILMIDDVMKRQIRTTAEFLTAGCHDDYERVKALNDWICQKVYYDREGNSLDNHADYSVYLDDNTVCAGYAQGFALLAQSIDIETLVVSSGSHAWNIVKLGNNYYHLDVTWNDDPDDRTGTKWNYNWFLRDDQFTKSEQKNHRSWNTYNFGELYCKNKSYSSIPKCNIKHGDGNCDGYVNKSDYNLLRDYLSKRNPKIENIYMFDMNGDGKIDQTDLSALGLLV